MLSATFCHIPGIGPRAERRLWDEGIRSWEQVASPDELPLSPARSRVVADGVRESRRRLAAADPRWFYRHLGNAHHWRLFPEFRSSVAYLDIETTGLGNARDHVTTIALYDGADVHTYVHGRNLDRFPRDVARYSLLVTYNGKTFDLPFLRRAFGVRLDQAHIDLRYVLARLGYKGGLKGCEKSFGLDRAELDGVDGFFAVLLWRHYRRHRDERALRTLLAYNVADVVNLETLMVRAYNLLLADTPFEATHALPLPPAPPAPFQPDPETIACIRSRPRW
jgi:uncharacterized protein YprB with RNaseH-like and TPR domain